MRKKLTQERLGSAGADIDLIMAARLARQLGISAVTLWRWRNTEGFPQGRRIRNHVYFSRAAVLEWLERQQQAA
jgi:predicted DNA-binding transcriptional regulator AlpA